MKEKEQAIAVFDSGVGGISVLRELLRLMPMECYLYFGDSAHAPYGSRPLPEVQALACAAADRLMAQGAKALVVACNTATSAAIDLLRRRYPDKIVIGIEPAVKLAAERHPGGSAVVLATEITCREHKFLDLVARHRDTCRISALPCPGLMEFVEAGILEGPRLEHFLRPLLAPCLEEGVDAIVLGCTHYPFVRDTIARIAGPSVEILDGGPGTARETRRRLAEAGLLREHGPGSVSLDNSLGTPEILALSRRLMEYKSSAVCGVG